jgi:signal transduction histidine kinase/putative methionine-R-sulfoxide reductase with GAF domain
VPSPTAEFLAAVLRTAAHPICVVDPDGLIVFANPAAVAALGYDRADELLGRPGDEAIHSVAVSAPIELAEGVGAVVTFGESTEDLATVAEDQAALRRVATLVAGGAPPEAVFSAVAAEVGRLARTGMVMLSRYDHDGTATVVGALGDHTFQPGVRWSVDGPSAQRTALETGRSVRSDDVADGPGTIAAESRRFRLNSRVAVPIMVAGKVWGVIGTASSDGRLLPPEIDTRLEQFTELVATAISNTQAREELGELAEEQAALRRVATLVARGASPDDVFGAVAAEIGRLAAAQMVLVSRDEHDGTASVVGAWGEHPLTAGARWSLDGPSISRTVLESGRSARTEDAPDGPGAIADVARALGVHSRVGVPIVVDGEIWGVVAAGAADRRSLPLGIEPRLAQFTELIATAVSNTQAREELRELAEEQAALRRVATLVAGGARAEEIFDAVCVETAQLLGASTINLAHFTEDGVNVTMAGWSERGVHVPPGTRLPLEGDCINTLVLRTAAPGRFDTYEGASGELAARLRALGIRSEVGAPVVIEGRVWGALFAGTDEPDPLPAGTELRLGQFTELIATAVSNATARSALIASRARIVQAADEQRRRVVRDLHDGAQQRLVQLGLMLQLGGKRDDVPDSVRRLHDELFEQTELAIRELRELAHGIHPAILSHYGLAAAVDALAQRAPVPVRVEIPDRRYPQSIESAAYFVAAEALTNVAKHAGAQEAEVVAGDDDGRLVLEIRDDGAGGASTGAGSGLAGLVDRVAAVGGTLAIDSPPGSGTTVRAELPLSIRS